MGVSKVSVIYIYISGVCWRILIKINKFVHYFVVINFIIEFYIAFLHFCYKLIML